MLMTFLLRLVLIAAGLIFAASLAVAMALMLVIWCVRAVWAKLTGRPVMPFIIRIDPRGGFDRMYRRAQQAKRPAPGAPAKSAIGDVTDVEVKEPRG